MAGNDGYLSQIKDLGGYILPALGLLYLLKLVFGFGFKVKFGS